MPAMRNTGTTAFALTVLAALLFPALRCHGQAALLMEEPYGFFGSINPTGHNALYFQRVCAETPIKLRRCAAGEHGAVISRYAGIDGYDWVAIPLIPYLYSVEDASEVPAHVDRATVERLRGRYREAHLLSLGEDLPPGNILRSGWTQLVGLSYERRIYAFRFETTAEQDDAFIARLNGRANRSHFNLFYNNCSDFARTALNGLFPGAFKRSPFPDADMTTPKQIAGRLVRYSQKRPQMRLTVFEIPQIPGLRRHSRANKNIAESLTTTGYALPIAMANPYLAGGLFVDFMVHSRFHPIPRHPIILQPFALSALTEVPRPAQNPDSAGAQAPGTASSGPAIPPVTSAANSGLKEIKATHE